MHPWQHNDWDSAVRLPNSDKAVIQPEKLKDYLLSHSHPIGHFKARFFQSLGFTAGNWRALEIQIRGILANEAVEKEHTEYGQKYEIRANITGPAGHRAEIVTVWIVLKNEQIPRLITAYPGDCR